MELEDALAELRELARAPVPGLLAAVPEATIDTCPGRHGRLRLLPSRNHFGSSAKQDQMKPSLVFLHGPKTRGQTIESH
jgi:hypothetical protein